MTLIINPGSGPVSTGDEWTNTLDGARKIAYEWLTNMRREGLVDVDLLDEVEPGEGRWCFKFRHRVTGVVVILETHGLDNFEAYERRHVFGPRTYWNGSSCSTPELTDWAAEGFGPVQTYREVGR